MCVLFVGAMSSKDKKAIASSSMSENQRLMLNLALKTNFGLVCSGILSLLLARKSGGRLFITGIGTGTGFGYAWCQNDVYLKDRMYTCVCVCYMF